MKSRFLPILVFFLTFPLLSSEPVFFVDHLSYDNRLLFRARTVQPGWSSYDTLLSSNLGSRLDSDIRMEILSFFPERSRYFGSINELEIQNRFGLFRLNIRNGTSRTLDFYPAFSSGAVLKNGRVLPVASSPDGNWTVLQEPQGDVRSELVLYHSISGTRYFLTTGTELSYREAPVRWSPDSRYLLYSREGRLYWVSVAQLVQGQLPDESYRDFGSGELASVRWAGPDELYHIDGELVRMLRPSEFFTHTFYNGPLISETINGGLPVRFDPHFDEFWPSPDGQSVLFLKNRKFLFLFSLDKEGSSLPFLALPPGHTILQIWWQRNGEILFLSGSGDERSSDDSQIYRFGGSDGNSRFVPLDVEAVRRFSPSPNRRQLATLGPDGVHIRSTSNLESRMLIVHPDPRDLFWIDNENLLVCGAYRSEIINISTGDSQLLALSQCEKSGFDTRGTSFASSSGRSYQYDEHLGQWVAGGSLNLKVSGSSNRESQQFRVFTEYLENSLYANRVIVRRIDGLGNRILFPVPDHPVIMPAGDKSAAADGPEPESRVFRRAFPGAAAEIALIFDISDGDDGLNEVLRVLDDYDIRSTFFVGGDFIRRHPLSVRKLAESPHEVGSLFYTEMDMTDWRYRVDQNFVMQGLARNEDEFFSATGSEVSTLWHAPWYVISPPIIEGGEAMNYLNVGRDMDTLDWVSLDSIAETPNLYKPSLDLVDQILETVRNGSIIPVTIGRAARRKDYLFNYLDLLINGLLEKGYHIVPVSVLREHSR